MAFCGVAPAQLPAFDVGSPAGLNLALMRVFGDAAFTAKAEIRVLDKAGTEVLGVPMDFALLDRNIRVQMDITQLRHKDLPAALAGSLKQLGMSQVVSVIRPDKKSTLVIYPEQQSYLSMPLSKQDVEGTQAAKIVRSDLGKETVDGRVCVKRKVVLTPAEGKPLEAIVWYASDLKDFPVRIQSTEKDNTSVISFKEIKMGRPEAKQFEAPSGFKQYGSYQQMIQGLMSKLLGGGGEEI